MKNEQTRINIILSLVLLTGMLTICSSKVLAAKMTITQIAKGSIVVLEGHRFVKLGAEGSNGPFMALERVCNYPIIRSSGNICRSGESVTLTVTANGMGGKCSWSSTQDPSLSTLVYLETDSNNCTVRVNPTATTTYTVSMVGCAASVTNSMTVNVSTALSTGTTGGQGNMQTWSNCNDYCTPTGGNRIDIGTLTDNRDGKQYTVAKFADGKCWMSQNLAYGGGTDGTADYCAAVTTAENWRNATSQALAGAVATNGLNPTDGSRNTLFGNCTNILSTAAYCSTGAGAGKCGYLYNWPAVMQSDQAYYGSAYGSNRTTEFARDANGNYQGICPAGWHLPGGSTSDFSGNNTPEFSTLSRLTGENYNGANWYLGNHFFQPGNGFNAVYSGFADSSSGSAYNQGSYFYLWSSTYSSSEYAYNLSVNSNGFMYPADNNYKSYGFAVRCIKD